jgi:hypothetical protein
MQALALIVNLAALVICISVAIAVDNSSIAAVALGVLSVLAACGCALGVAARGYRIWLVMRTNGSPGQSAS